MAHDSHYATCIAACNACADACDHCMVACLHEPDPRPMARCIEHDVDCAAICRLAAACMARDSELAARVCELCAEACEACAAECAKHAHMEHCKRCAEACRRCAEECRRMAAKPAGRRAGGSAGKHAH